MKRIIIYVFLISATLGACSDFLDVADEQTNGLQNLDQVFDNVGYTRRYYANVFTGVPDYSAVINAGGFSNPWMAMTDEVIAPYGDVGYYVTSDKNEENVKFHRWGDAYKLIRQANIFLAKVKPIQATGSQADVLTEEQVAEMKANVRFMRAFYHYMLFEQYGSIQLVKDKIFEEKDNFDIPRAPLDEVINYIDSELLAVAQQLKQVPIEDEQYRALPTKGVALAVRAKLWMYAASPLLNGGYSEALTIMTPYGPNGEKMRMYPDYDANKWQKAKEAVKDFIDYAEAGNYELYSTNNPIDDVYELFQKYTKEIIWATASNNWGGMDQDSFDRRATPRSEQNGLGSIAVYQELVDDFYMEDGLPIKNTDFLSASPLYSETGFTDLDGSPVHNMWVKREPRFYNTVFYQGRKWHITNNVINFHLGSANDKNGQHTPTGYLLYKRFNRKVHKRPPGVVSKFRPSIIFRLADFYLLYAEVLNEVTPSDSDVLLYLNKVRTRAGLPDIEKLNPSIAGNKELQRKAIRRERRIELATEGQRYFDVRRWMIADQPEGNQNRDMYGMDMDKDISGFYTRKKVHRNVFTRKMYLHPVPFYELQKTKGAVVQNPGWRI
ncbi:RagB/SusD family nutrient uptake outer membrane protein [Capnocytophaga sp.]|uniref:RagB/SusD family nutrient uptake outer membrane protein n=1 Tax=Capnocytophaga sp. TaxID=44737 RepID=UPI0026DA7DA6|nr:RagB/SusD family nutrient uptake outer membrane protein [Capnocytophaga sp.]MDO5105116.1 RagB/SusD family nutrient uptake outer membrane protein [Capnocytophaga sp.]